MQIKCSECGTLFTTANNRRIYCSRECSFRFHNRRTVERRRTKRQRKGKFENDIRAADSLGISYGYYMFLKSQKGVEKA